MSRIFTSVGGEGCGHATRALAVIEDLRRDHKITVYASAQAFELLRSKYRDGEVTVGRHGAQAFPSSASTISTSRPPMI